MMGYTKRAAKTRRNLRRHSSQLPTQAVIPLILTSMLLIAIAIGLLIRTLNRKEEKAKRCTLETTACCVQVDKVYRNTDDPDRNTVYYPVFKYEVNGNSYAVQADTGSSTKDDYEKGKYYKIYVDPNKPEDFVMNNSTEFIGTAKWIIAGIGVIPEIVFTIYLISFIRKKRRQNESGEYDDLSGDYYGTDDEYDDYR